MVTNNASNEPTAASGTVLQGQGVGTHSSYSTAAYPATTTVNQILYSSSANVVGGLSTANSAILATDSSGVPSITTASGNWLNTSRTAFLALPSGNLANVTGDGTAYTVAFNSATFDQGSNYNTGTFTFTAPVTGKYFFTTALFMTGILVGHTACLININVSGRTSYIYNCNPFAMSTGGSLYLSGSTFLNMTATNTATVVITVTGSTKVINLFGSTNGSFFSGFLVC